MTTDGYTSSPQRGLVLLALVGVLHLCTTHSLSPTIIRHRSTSRHLQSHGDQSNIINDNDNIKINVNINDNDTVDNPNVTSRRRMVLTSILFAVTGKPFPSFASDEFIRQTKDVSYAFTPPPQFEETKKTLPTHLDEVNFVSTNMKGYQFGITVDPVRIKTLADFGSPEEVAAKVVMAEVNRDGVLDVTLVGDPVALNDNMYLLDYISKGKRGEKHFVCKIVVQSGKLHVMTAQVLEENYDAVKKELAASVNSFHVLY